MHVFHLKSGDWVQQLTSGTPPLGVSGYACAAVDDELHYSGGGCGHDDDCCHNGVHKLSTSSLQCMGDVVPHHIIEDGAPMKKASLLWYSVIQGWGGGYPSLFVVGGIGTTPSSRQPRAHAV